MLTEEQLANIKEFEIQRQDLEKRRTNVHKLITDNKLWGLMDSNKIFSLSHHGHEVNASLSQLGRYLTWLNKPDLTDNQIRDYYATVRTNLFRMRSHLVAEEEVVFQHLYGKKE